MADDGGVLENLPNSRPGRRSAKREGGGAKRAAGTAAKAATRAERTGSRAAKAAPGTASRASTGAAPEGQAGRKGTDRPQRPSDPVGDAIRAAAGVATTGARIAHGVTREVLRRLPRP